MVGSPSRPDGIVLTGDLADTGDPVAYGLLAERIDALTAATGAPVVCVPGNHDDRSAFGRQLLGWADDATVVPIDQISWFGGLRVVSLDTVVPGSDAGRLSDAQLQWLGDQLATPAPDGTIVAVHHPPIGSPIRSMSEIGLEHPERLAAILDGTDVCLVLAGHNHHGSAGMLGQVPVWVGPALSYRSDPLVEDRYVGTLGSAFSRIDVVDGRALVTFVPVPPSTGERPAGEKPAG